MGIIRLTQSIKEEILTLRRHDLQVDSIILGVEKEGTKD